MSSQLETKKVVAKLLFIVALLIAVFSTVSTVLLYIKETALGYPFSPWAIVVILVPFYFISCILFLIRNRLLKNKGRN
ncbi:hypothetical protein ACS78_02250 [Priestia megaterium]|nr:hypothetical protein ACS78_02250 [Priestia megaterium]